MLIPARALVGAVSLATLGALALPSSAEVVSPELRTYAHCGSSDKAVLEGTTSYAMDETAPTKSFTANGGCGTLDSDKRDDDGIELTGTYTGNLDRLTVDAHVIDAGGVRVGVYEEIYANLSVTVDGKMVVAGEEVHLTPIPSSTGVSRLLQFSVVGFGLTAEDQAGTHEVTIALNSASYIDGDQVAWVLDATEVQTGVVYSPQTLADVVVGASPVKR